MNLPISNAVSLIRIEREKKARAEHRSKAELQAAIGQAREGKIRPYVNLQWPSARLDPWQWDILESLFDPSIRRVFVKGNTGCGKGASAGIACCMYYHIWDDAKIVITRDSADRAVDIAFGEVTKWWNKMRYRPPGVMLGATAYENKQHIMRVVNPKEEEGFRGAHSENVLFWFDEATSPNLEDKFDIAMTQAKKFLALSNPSTLAGSFRAAFPKSDPDTTQTFTDQYGRTRCITIDGYQCTNVKEKCLEQPIGPIGGITIGERHYRHGEPISPEDFAKCRPIVPGQTCYDEFMSLLHHPDPIKRNVYALGKFPDEDPDKQLILQSWLSKPRNSIASTPHPLLEMVHKWSTLSPVDYYREVRKLFEGNREAFNELFPIEGGGLDVAASKHGDSSVLALGGAYGVREIHECQFKDTQQTMEWVLEVFASYGIDLPKSKLPLGIDWGGGYGNAVGDPLKQRRVNVVEIHGNASSDVDSKKYANKRAELYGEAGRRLDPHGDFRMIPFMMPDNQNLQEELTAPQKIFAGHDGEKFYITPKDRRGASDNFKGKTIKELLGRSPDRGDAVVYLLCALRTGVRRKFIFA